MSARRSLKPIQATAPASEVQPAPLSAAPASDEPQHAAAQWREHDLMIRRFHHAGMIPGEIAVILNSKGLRVRTWHVSETFVRNRLKALGFQPNLCRNWYAQVENRYRDRPADAEAAPSVSAEPQPLKPRRARSTRDVS